MTVENRMQATEEVPHVLNTYRTTARAVGVLFLAAIATYLTGNGLIQSILSTPDHLSIVPAKSTQLGIGAMLMLVNSAVVAGIGILMLPVLKRHNESIAFGYFGSRIVESVVLAVGVVFLLLQIPLGREYLKAGASDTSYLQALSTLSTQASQYAYQFGMIAVGLGGVMLGYLFYRAQLVPRLVAVWGLVGYALLLCGAVVEVLGVDLALLFSIPGGLWEMFIGAWLIVKGFRYSPLPSELTTSSSTTTPPRIHPTTA